MILTKTAVQGESGSNLPERQQARTIVEYVVVHDFIGVGPDDPLQLVEARTDRSSPVVFPPINIRYATPQRLDN